MTRRKYYIEVLLPSKGWWRGAGAECTREYGMGYLARCREEQGIRYSVRLVRDDDKILDHSDARTEVSIGQVAGHPTAEQYREAAARALATADRIDALHRPRSG